MSIHDLLLFLLKKATRCQVSKTKKIIYQQYRQLYPWIISEIVEK